MSYRIYLSPPDTDLSDREALLAAFDSGWVAPVGPHLDQFEESLLGYTGRPTVALASGTAALHLALLAADVKEGDNVWVSNLTFAASVFAVLYLKAQPVLLPSQAGNWNAAADIAEEWLSDAHHTPPKAVVLTHLYGWPADIDHWKKLSEQYGFALIADGAESLGALWAGNPVESATDWTALSFNGNKIITTSGGGALTCPSLKTAQRIRQLASQNRTPDWAYTHEDIGYNYRLSNLLSALGKSQLARLGDKVTKKQTIFSRYQAALPDCQFQQALPSSIPNYWLTTALFPTEALAKSCLAALQKEGIEARPAWKPMHYQPFSQSYQLRLLAPDPISEQVFETGLCLPSGSSLSPQDQSEIVEIIRHTCR